MGVPRARGGWILGTGDGVRVTEQERAEPEQTLTDEEFAHELEAVLPSLRAFGRSLSGSRDLADDLVQETMMKAWAARERFRAGTSFRAWTFVILRNAFLSDRRKQSTRMESGKDLTDDMITTPPSQDRRLILDDLQRALMKLPEAWREALVLVGAGGVSYQEAAEICGCPIGTIRSRVARARAEVDRLMQG
ncbi:MAG: sigma-70 family RNA polymerase sigma factor [Alphaproteobacteria bacterium]|nr:sigma-70 family RNA polymerase sigma factor [Alphaproteobacteria bacterium]